MLESEIFQIASWNKKTKYRGHISFPGTPQHHHMAQTFAERLKAQVALAKLPGEFTGMEIHNIIGI